MSMSASEALDYALNSTFMELGPVPRLVLIYVADKGTLDVASLARATGAPPHEVQAAIALLASRGYLDAIRNRWAA